MRGGNFITFNIYALLSLIDTELSPSIFVTSHLLIRQENLIKLFEIFLLKYDSNPTIIYMNT